MKTFVLPKFFSHRLTSYASQKYDRNISDLLICTSMGFFKPITQFPRIHTSSLINTEKILNRPTTQFYNGDGVNAIAAELRLTKMRSNSFYKKYNILY